MITSSEYDLADALGLALEVSGDEIRGSAKKDIVFGPLRLGVPLSVVSSHRSNDGTALLCKSFGNLALLAVTKYNKEARVTLCLLNLAKMPAPAGLLEKRKLSRPQDAVDDLKEAIVATFHLTKGYRWVREGADAPVA